MSTTNPATMREARHYEAAVERGEAPPSIDLSPHHVTPMTLAIRPLRFTQSTNEWQPKPSLCLAPRPGQGPEHKCTRPMDHDGQHINHRASVAWGDQS